MKIKRLDKVTVKVDGVAHINVSYLFNWLRERIMAADFISEKEKEILTDFSIELGSHTFDEHKEDEGVEVA